MLHLRNAVDHHHQQQQQYGMHRMSIPLQQQAPQQQVPQIAAATSALPLPIPRTHLPSAQLYATPNGSTTTSSAAADANAAAASMAMNHQHSIHQQHHVIPVIQSVFPYGPHQAGLHVHYNGGFNPLLVQHAHTASTAGSQQQPHHQPLPAPQVAHHAATTYAYAAVPMGAVPYALPYFAGHVPLALPPAGMTALASACALAAEQGASGIRVASNASSISPIPSVASAVSSSTTAGASHLNHFTGRTPSPNSSSSFAPAKRGRPARQKPAESDDDSIEAASSDDDGEISSTDGVHSSFSGGKVRRSQRSTTGGGGGVEKLGKSKRGRKQIPLTEQQIEKYLHYPQNTAAKLLGVSTSTLKRRFRELGRGRWPTAHLPTADKHMILQHYGSDASVALA